MLLPDTETGIAMTMSASSMPFLRAISPGRHMILLSRLRILAVFAAEPRAMPRSMHWPSC